MATVGKGTAKILAAEYASGTLTAPTFTPSKANAETLVDELPLNASGAAACRVLYPASAKAAKTLQEGLAARGATVTRLDTYSTEKVTSVDETTLNLALTADVVTFGSPSAVKAWLAITGLAADAGDIRCTRASAGRRPEERATRSICRGCSSRTARGWTGGRGS